MPSVITPASLRNAAIAIRTQFEELQGQLVTNDPLLELVTFVDTDGPFNLYAWLGQFPDFREWVGPRLVHGLSQRAFTIPNKEYELTVGMDRTDLDDAKSVNRQLILNGIAERAAYLPRKLVIEALRTGQAKSAYDGQGFFDTDHPTDVDLVSGTQSNYEASSFPLTQANFVTARARLRGFKGENGTSFGVGFGAGLTLFIPQELEAAADAFLSVQNISVSGGTTNNVLYNAARKAIIPELSVDPTTWYLAWTSGVLRPIVVQRRTSLNLISKDSQQDDNVFWHKEYIFGGNIRLGTGYGAWMKIFKGVG